MPSDRPEILFEVTENTSQSPKTSAKMKTGMLAVHEMGAPGIYLICCMSPFDLLYFCFLHICYLNRDLTMTGSRAISSGSHLCSRSMQQLFMDISGCLRKPCCWPKHQNTNQQLHWDFKSWQPSNFEIAATTFISEDYACLQTVRWTDLGKICMCGICYLDIKHLDWLLVYTVCEST